MAVTTSTASVLIVGFKELEKKLKKAGKDGIWMVARALYIEGEGMMGDSKQRYVPVDTGILRSTGHVTLPIVRGPTCEIILGYGGPAAKYAIVQHEADYEHRVGERKYLETPVLMRVPSAGRRMAVFIRRDLAKYAAR